jgi:hypothetical protein
MAVFKFVGVVALVVPKGMLAGSARPVGDTGVGGIGTKGEVGGVMSSSSFITSAGSRSLVVVHRQTTLGVFLLDG